MNLPNVLMIGKDPLSGEWKPSPRVLGPCPWLWAAVGHSAGRRLGASTVKTRDQLGEILKGGLITLGMEPRAHVFLKNGSARPLPYACRGRQGHRFAGLRGRRCMVASGGEGSISSR